MNYNEIKKEIVEELFKFSKERFNKNDFEIAFIAVLRNEKMDRVQFEDWFLKFYSFSPRDEEIRKSLFMCYETSYLAIKIKISNAQELARLSDISNNSRKAPADYLTEEFEDMKENVKCVKEELSELKNEIKRIKTEKE